MNKIFGKTGKGGQDWFLSDAYSDKEIDSIKDPNGGMAISMPTAIPSPFARIDLVKTAFKNIAKSTAGKLKAYTTEDGSVIAGRHDEKLVSDTLDLAELLFNYDSIKDDLKIIIWDRDRELKALREGSTAHKRLADTLELYLEQDQESYNFNLLKRLYLIEYKYKIIGCTSPATLFFVTANDLKDAQISLTTNDVFFDDSYVPLYERDPEFQKYIYGLFASNPILKANLTVFNDYLNKSLVNLERENHKLYTEIKNLDATNFENNYSELDTGLAGEVVEIIGIPLRKRKKENIIASVQSSDFIINSNKYFGDNKPLILQDRLNKKFKYAEDYWDVATKVPSFDPASLDKRKLPGLRIQYPYLTISDFLEPFLIRFVYPINNEKFFDGNLEIEQGDDSKGYALPLKKAFFDYFTTDDLTSTLPNKPQITLTQGVSGSVKVTLKIPVAKNNEYISFERIYYQSPENQIGRPDEENNKGVIIEHQFGITVFPFMKTTIPNLNSFYRVQLIDRDVVGPLRNTELKLNFYSNSSSGALNIRANKSRSIKKPDAVETANSQYYVLDSDFDFIQVQNIVDSGASGIILPKWQPYQQGNEVFSFAIDFGTTNTHIEYKIGNGGTPKPFDITSEDLQIATLFHPSKTTDDFSGSGAIAIRELIEHEFVPHLIGNSSEYKFPQRTVISESHSLNIDTETFSLADFNIPFVYERKPEKDKIQSNLKWAKKEKGNDKRVRAFFENIIMLMRNKVLLNKGDLEQTRLIWFYPSSMKIARKSSLENTWNELFRQYFNPANPTIGISESLAPFYFFKNTNRLQGAFKPVVSIDIGGGTTDIVVFKQNKPMLMSSFKFGANTIFGDGYSEFGAASSNGIINKYYPHYENLLITNKLYDLSKVLSTIKEKNRTEDLNAFFFSIENNSKIKDKKLFSYNELLANDEDLKILFIYYYSAIIYHVAELMHHKGIELPKHLVFSGTGSKILNIITSDLKILSKISKYIFEEVYDAKFDVDDLTVETEKEIPKEVTCKGGLMSNTEDLAFDIRDIKSTLTCLENIGLSTLKYSDLIDSNNGLITNYVENFNKIFLQLNAKFNLNDNFNATEASIKVVSTEINKHLRDYLEEGIQYNKKLDDIGQEDREIEESLFFYPLIGTINNLSSHLSKLS